MPFPPRLAAPLLLPLLTVALAGAADDLRLAAITQRLAGADWEQVWQGTPDGPKAGFAHDVEVFHSAPDSLRLIVPAGAGPANSRVVLCGAEDQVGAGELRLSGMVRLDGGEDLIAIVSVHGFDADWKRSPDQQLAVFGQGAARGAWVPFSGTATLPAGLNQVVLQLAVVKGSGTVRLDDLAVIALPSAR